MAQGRKIVIIGAGIAGITAAEAARKQDADASISVISRELYLPYYRLRICEIIDNPAITNSLSLHPAAWYSDRRIDVMLDQHVEKIVSDNNEVILADGSRLPYDALVLCSGSESFKPTLKGIDRPGVYTIWTITDALRIEVALRQVKNAVVIGGGLLGLEAAYHFKRKGTETTIVEKLPRLLANQLDETGSEIFARKVKGFGVKVITSGDIVSIEGIDASDDSPARRIVFADGSTIETELVLVSIGVRANTFLAQSAGLDAGKRIETDDRMQTSAVGIYAAGDAAEPHHFWFGLWSVSREQGRVAGTNAAGGDAVFDRHIPPYLLNTMETKVAVLGEQGSLSEPQYELDVLMDTNSGNYRKLVYREGIFRGFMLIGDTRAFAKLSKDVDRHQD